MIRYSLICADKHRFDSWFASADAFETLLDGGHITCAVCGSTEVAKAVMAPSVRAGHAYRPNGTPESDEARPLRTPASPAEAALAEFRRRVDAESDYVGPAFAREARAIHNGDSPRRSIHGEADAGEARSLLEDGIPILPLPFASGRKTN